MIAVYAPNGSRLKALMPGAGRVYGMHSVFGLIAEDAISALARRRKLSGVRPGAFEWVFKFKLGEPDKNGALVCSDVTGAKGLKVSDSQFDLATAHGVYSISIGSSAKSDRWASSESQSTEIKIGKKAAWGLLLLPLLFIPYFFPQETKKEEAPVVMILPETIEAVTVPNYADGLRGQPEAILQQTTQAKRAIASNLGFLGMLGQKNLKKALGGLPTSLEKASAGAGAGGLEGSGGELLVGLGEGLERVTVGNTGTQGLGGIGTKGRGGGAGGYGHTLVGSGEGKVLSAMPVSDELVLEGGLDRSVIQATIAKYLNQVRSCYETGLRANPSLSGQVTVAFEINGTGALNFARVQKTSLNNSPVEKCIEDRMLGWAFPKPRGGVKVNVNYPFLLRPVNS